MKQDIKNDQYRRLLGALSFEYGNMALAGWFGLGDERPSHIRSLRSHINRKLVDESEKWHRNATASDVFVAELLAFLDAEGYNLNRMERDPDGRLITIPKRTVIRHDREVHRIFDALREGKPLEPIG